MRRGHHPGAVFAVLAVGVAAFSLLQSLIVPVLPEIQQHYGSSQSSVTWVLTAYLLSAAVCTPLVGRIGDAYGKRRMLVVALVALAVGSLLGGLAPSLGWLVVARVVQGVGGGVLPLAFGIVREELGGHVTAALSALSSLLAVGYGLGIVVAGPILEGLGYRWLYWLPMLVTAATALATLLLVPESRERTAERLPALPALLLTVWLVALLVPISRGPQWGWSSPWTLGGLTLAALVLALWVRAELHAEVPLIDMTMMRVRGVWTANVIGAAVGFSMFASFGFLPQLLQTPPELAGYGFGASVMGSGLLILPSQICAFVVGFAAAPLVRRLGTRAVLAAGSTATGASMLALGLWHDETWQVLAATGVQGAGSGLVFATLAGVLVTAVPSRQTAVASGVNANMRSVFGAIGATLMGVVVGTGAGVGSYPAEAGYTWGYVMLAVVMTAAVAASWCVPDSRLRPAEHQWQDAVDAELGLVPGAPSLPIERPAQRGQ
jgi:MFS family permease